MTAAAQPTSPAGKPVGGPDDLPGALSLPAILAERAARESDRRAYTFLNEYGEETAVLTYGDLHVRALAVAAELAARCEPGDRALLAFPPGLDFVAAFFGCLYARVVAVPIQPPRRNTAQGATSNIVRDCAPAVVLGTDAALETVLPVVEPLRSPGCAPVTGLAVDRIGDATGRTDAFRPPECPPEGVAFLQYTSGSTADPKGVMVAHGNLMANQRMIADAFGHDRDSTVVGWTPLFHDQGLIGNVLQPLFVGADCVLMSPTAFIRWPLLWLTAISRYRAHTSGGPNFAFDACVARAARGDVADLDLSCWQVAFNGAEPLRAETLRRFTDTFGRHGFRPQAHFPCFGLAESTLLVTGSRKGRGARLLTADADALGHGWYRPPLGADARVRTLVGSGAVPDDGVLIVDPETLHRCPPGRVGEIWVSGAHVARGYWRRPELTATTFQARPARGPDRAHLRTGDLGVVVDGELYVVGRRKDLVIIRGRNIHPQDIEQTAEAAHPALKAGGCAVFGVPGPDGADRLVVVQEVRRDGQRTADPTELAAAIRAAVSREHEVSPADVVLTPNRLAKTSSGKLMRAAARQRYLDGGFERWTPPVPSAV